MSIENEDLKKIVSNLMKPPYVFDDKVALELIFMSSFLWIVSIIGFKFNQVHQYINIQNWEVSSFYFALYIFIYFIFAVFLSFKLAVKTPKLEILWIVIFGFINGMVLSSLMMNLVTVYEIKANLDVLNIAFNGSLFFSSLITSSIRHIENKTNNSYKYLPIASLFFCCGLFLYILSFAGFSDFGQSGRYLLFCMPMLFIFNTYISILYLCGKNSKSYVNQQLVNIFSILFTFSMIPLSFICF